MVLNADGVLERPGRVFKITDYDQVLTPEVLNELLWGKTQKSFFF